MENNTSILERILLYLKSLNIWTVIMGLFTILAAIFTILSYIRDIPVPPKVDMRIEYLENDCYAFPDQKNLNFVYVIHDKEPFRLRKTNIPVTFVSREATNKDVTFEYEIISKWSLISPSEGSQQKRYGDLSHVVHDFGQMKPNKDYPVLDTLLLMTDNKMAIDMEYSFFKRTSKCDTTVYSVFAIRGEKDESVTASFLKAYNDLPTDRQRIFKERPTYLVNTMPRDSTLYADIQDVRIVPDDLYSQKEINDVKPSGVEKAQKKRLKEKIRKWDKHKSSGLYDALIRHHMIVPIFFAISTFVSTFRRKKEG